MIANGDEARILNATCNLEQLMDDYQNVDFQGHSVNIKLFGKDLIGWQFNKPPQPTDLTDKAILSLLAGFDCVIYNDLFKIRGRLSLQYGLFIFDEDIYYRETVCGNGVPASLAVPKHHILNGDSDFLRSDPGFHCHACFLESVQPFTQIAKHIIMSADMSNSLKDQSMIVDPDNLQIS